MKRSAGSVLVLVLWVLMLVSFMAAEHAAQNREGAGLTLDAHRELERQQMATSLIRLFSVDGWPLPHPDGQDGSWFALQHSQQTIWLRADDESQRINLNQASEGDIRNAIRQAFELARMEGADSIADSILDWRDEDDLVRLEGAESDWYESQGYAYQPANGPFKALTELLLVKDVAPLVFLGETLEQIAYQQSEFLEELDIELPLQGLMDLFTLFPREVRRLTLLIPLAGGSQPEEIGGHYLEYIFMVKRQAGWHVLQRYRLFTEHGR